MIDLPSPALLFPLFVVAVVTIIIYKSIQKKRRREAFWAWANGRGWSFSETDPFGILNLSFPLLGRGDGRGFDHVVWGNYEGLQFKEADYWYYVRSRSSKGGSTRNYSYFTILLIDLPAHLPHLSISRESLLSRIADALSFRDIEFESGDFNKAFQVKADDREFAFKVIDAGMMQWLMALRTDFAFDLLGSQLLVACRRLGTTGEVEAMMSTTNGFVDAIPQLVWNQYTTRKSG